MNKSPLTKKQIVNLFKKQKVVIFNSEKVKLENSEDRFLYKNIKSKISEYKFIDFLRGSEEYKYRIGCINQDLITIKIKRKS